VGTVHTTSAINQEAENTARQVVQVMPAGLKVRLELADSWKIALVTVRQLIVFQRQNHRRFASGRQMVIRCST
jgi:hypothetical protein